MASDNPTKNHPAVHYIGPPEIDPCMSWKIALDAESQNSARLANELDKLRAVLAEVYAAYIDEFGPNSLHEDGWPAYRFQRAIEAARLLTDSPVPPEDNRD